MCLGGFCSTAVRVVLAGHCNYGSSGQCTDGMPAVFVIAELAAMMNVLAIYVSVLLTNKHARQPMATGSPCQNSTHCEYNCGANLKCTDGTVGTCDGIPNAGTRCAGNLMCLGARCSTGAAGEGCFLDNNCATGLTCSAASASARRPRTVLCTAAADCIAALRVCTVIAIVPQALRAGQPV